MKTKRRLQDLTIKDNFMFCAVMSEEENCIGFLEMVLGFPIAKIDVSYIIARWIWNFFQQVFHMKNCRIHLLFLSVIMILLVKGYIIIHAGQNVKRMHC